jgi:hypothetical protein
MADRITTILGVEYRGRPKVGSLAFDIWNLEQNGEAQRARNMLKAKNAINKVYGAEPIDLQRDMTDLPMEGVEITGAR